MERKEHWAKVYSEKTALEVSWYQADPTTSLQMIEQTGCSQHAAMIDVGGGASVLVDRLLQDGYDNLTVLDISGGALEFAKRRLGSKGGDVGWIEADVTHFCTPQPYDIWHDRAVFHFLTDGADREKYIATLKHSLPLGGHFILATFALGGPERCSGLDIVQYDSEKIKRELGSGFNLVDERAESHMTPAGGTQEFAYFRFTRRA